MVLGIENWPNNVTGLFFASRLGYMLHGFVYTSTSLRDPTRELQFDIKSIKRAENRLIRLLFWMATHPTKRVRTLKSSVAPAGITKLMAGG